MNLVSLLRRSFATASILTVIGLSTAFSQERNTNDYLVTGYGTDLVRSQDNNPIQGANIEYKMIETSGDSIFDPVNYQTNEQGTINYTNLPLHWEMYVGMPEVKITQNEAIVFPNPSGGSTTVNIKTSKEPEEMELYNGLGELTDKIEGPVDYENGIAGYFVNCLTDDPDGMYYFRVKTAEGMASGKIIKRGNFQTIYGGIVEIPEEESSDNKASREIPYAIYQKTITAPGFDTLIVQETLYEGDHGTKLYFLEEEGNGNIPQYQYPGGTILDDDGNKISGALVRIEVGGETFEEMYTNAQGKFVTTDPIATGTEFVFDAVGGIEGKFSFSGDENETYQEITNPDDTLRLVYNYRLPEKEREVPDNPTVTVTPTADEVVEMDLTAQSEYGIRQEMLWEQSQGWTESQKAVNRTRLNNGMNMFGLNGVFTEVFYELNQNGTTGYDGYNTTLEGEIGVKVRPGTDNTSPYQENVEPTPGNIINVYPAADMTISQNETSFYKEWFVRVLGIGEVTSRNSVANPSAKYPNNKDKVIINMIATSYTYRLDDLTQYFSYENMVEAVEPEQKSSSKKDNEIYVGARQENIPEMEKALPSVDYVSNISY